MTTVAVLGGGVAGLTAADELSRRGYEVDLYDADKSVLGGKARSYPHAVPGPDLPAEHGFRFFPGFYRNVIETMAGIPARTGTGSVADRLVQVDEVSLFYGGGPGAKPKASRTLSWKGFAAAKVGQFHTTVDVLLNGGSPTPSKPFGMGDVAYLAHLLGVVALADRHKLLELEGYSFSDYTCNVFAQRSVLKPSKDLIAFLGTTGTRLLVAAQPDQMSARTGLVTLLRLLNPLELYTERGDRILPGPTNREWIDPWVHDLTSTSAHRPTAVTVHRGARVKSLAMQGTTATAFTLESGKAVTGFDHVVVALPHTAVRSIFGSKLPPSLQGLPKLVDGWMVGVQYFLGAASPKVCAGHSIHVDSPWSLTSIHAGQFWKGYPWPPSARDVLSVCVSDWDTPAPAPLGKAARHCTPAEVLDEVWRQLCDGINAGPGPDALPADRTGFVVEECIDEGVRFGANGVIGNGSPLFVNTVGSWANRPPADCGLANVFLAGDYVRTNVDLATMESANESARRSVQALLDADGHVGSPVKIIDIDHLGLLED